jgi:hypothetical protein
MRKKRVSGLACLMTTDSRRVFYASLMKKQSRRVLYASPLLRRSETRIVHVSVLFLQRLLSMNPQTRLCRSVSFVVGIGDASSRDASPLLEA